jgi:signal transduction histidine kinase
LTTLKTLTTDNALQQVEINRFEKLVSRRLSIFETVLRQNGSGFGGMRDALINIGGQQAMAAAAAQAEKIAEVERELLSKRTFASWGSEGFARMSFGIGLTFTLGVVAFSYYLLFIDFFNRKNAADRLRMAHDNLELRVAERTKELERSNRELQDFAFIASHDLQEPLRKIQLFGDRLRSKYSLLLDATGQDYLARMQNAATRMNRLIADLLMFSRLSSQQRPLEMVDLNSICRDVLSDLEASIDHYEGTVQCHPLPSVMADAMQMRQLLQNLLSNALKFHRPDVKPEVSIRWLNQEAFQADTSSETGPRESNEYRIAITDNGIGIEDQHIAKIFAPFQRLHGAGNEYEGTGIGLAVCTKIVERHHGNIQVLSTPGQGSTFVVALPVSPHTK